MPEASEVSESREALTDFRFGAIAVWGGFVSREAVEEALAEQSREQSAARSSGGAAPPVGELLVRRGDLTQEQVRRVLKVQLQRLPAEGHLIFGQIAEAHRFVSPGDNRRALDIQAREMLAGGRVRPIADILIEMGAIDREAADAVISYQARGDSTRMSKTHKARVESVPGPGPDARPRPAFLPRGKVGFVVDHSTWLVIAAAALFAIALVAFKERIFGAPGPRPPAETRATAP